jgi:ankyrin repeat protein
MRRLVAAGAKVDARDASGSTPLHTAASEGRTAAAAFLIQEARARLNAHDRAGCTPLHRAAAGKHAETAAILAAAGASLCAANKLQQTPLDVAGPFASLLQQAAAAGGGRGSVDV